MVATTEASKITELKLNSKSLNLERKSVYVERKKLCGLIS
jgi:hypothetical protein